MYASSSSAAAVYRWPNGPIRDHNSLCGSLHRFATNTIEYRRRRSNHNWNIIVKIRHAGNLLLFPFERGGLTPPWSPETRSLVPVKIPIAEDEPSVNFCWHLVCRPNCTLSGISSSLLSICTARSFLFVWSVRWARAACLRYSEGRRANANFPCIFFSQAIPNG